MKTLFPAVAVALAAAAVPAAAQEPVGLGTATSATAKLAASKPGALSDLAIRVTGTAPPAGVKLAPALRQTVTLPAGAKLRLPPKGEQVGTGLAVGDLNGNEVRFPLVVTAEPKALVFTAGDQSFRAVVSGARRLVFTVPTAGGALVPKLFTASLNDIAYTPRSCPKSRKWTSTIAFQALSAPDGSPFGPVQSLRSSSACRAAR